MQKKKKFLRNSYRRNFRLDCLKSETITSMMSEFAWNRAISPAIYVLTWNGMLRVDITSSKCEEIHFDWAKFGGEYWFFFN